MVVGAGAVVVVGAGASFGFDGFGCFCFFSTFGSPWCAWEGGTAGVAGVAGLEFGGRAGVAGIAGVARSCVSVFGFGFGPAGDGEEEGSGTLADGGVDGLPPAALALPLGSVGAGLELGVEGVAGEGAGVGVEGFGPPPPDVGPGVDGLRAALPPEPSEETIGTKPPNIGCAAGFDFVTACGPAGETRTGTLRACVLGTASSRMAARSLVDNAWTQSWADATAPAATAPT